MTREDLNQMCREYQAVLLMSETEVFAMYEESKAECMCNKQILNRHFSVKLNHRLIIETISLYY